MHLFLINFIIITKMSQYFYKLLLNLLLIIIIMMNNNISKHNLKSPLHFMSVPILIKNAPK